MIPKKCDGCMHRINDYCQAYQVKIELIDPDKCKRKKGTPLNINTINNLYHCKTCGYHSQEKMEYCPECEAFGFKSKLESNWKLSILSKEEYDELMDVYKEGVE